MPRVDEITYRTSYNSYPRKVIWTSNTSAAFDLTKWKQTLSKKLFTTVTSGPVICPTLCRLKPAVIVSYWLILLTYANTISKSHIRTCGRERTGRGLRVSARRWSAHMWEDRRKVLMMQLAVSLQMERAKASALLSFRTLMKGSTGSNESILGQMT